jgi:hypothetical protein
MNKSSESWCQKLTQRTLSPSTAYGDDKCFPSDSNHSPWHSIILILEQEISSSWETVVNGVPQVSILGPLLFIIYLNDLPYGLHHGATPVIYADGTGVLVTAKMTKSYKTKLTVR